MLSMEPDIAICLSLSEPLPHLSGRQLRSASRFVLVIYIFLTGQASTDGGNFVIVLPPAYFMTLMTEDALLDYFRSVSPRS
jgi:hypothetical protein